MKTTTIGNSLQIKTKERNARGQTLYVSSSTPH